MRRMMGVNCLNQDLQDFRICRIERWEDWMVGSHKSQENPQKSAETPQAKIPYRGKRITPLSEGMSTKDQNLLDGRGFSAKIGLI